MTSQPTSRRFRRLALAALSAISGAVIAVGAVESTTPTEANYIDRIKSKGTFTARWVDGGWAKTSTGSYTNHNSFVDRNVNAVSSRVDNAISVTTGVTNTTKSYNQEKMNANFQVKTPYPRGNAYGNMCAQAAAPGSNLATSSMCTNAPKAYTMKTAQTRATNWGISSGFANPSSSGSDPIHWMEANGVNTMAECSDDGITATASTPVANGIPRWNGSIGLIQSASEQLTLDPARGASDGFYTLVAPTLNTRKVQWIKPNYSNGFGYSGGTLYSRLTLTSRAFTSPGYALSDLYASLDVYSNSSDHRYLGTFTMIFGRSECGVASGANKPVPLAVEFENPNPPAYPSNPANERVVTTDAPVPDPTTGQLKLTTTSGLRAAPRAAAPTTTTVSTQAATSPLATSTGQQTTTSAPPTAGGATTSGTTEPGAGTPSSVETTAPVTTVSTTAPPAESPAAEPPAAQPPATPPSSVTVPADPGTLAATEPTTICGNLSIDGVFTDVLARGGTCPADARDSVLALDAWITSGVAADRDHRVFTSADPAADGWRWAVVSQVTGAVLYVR